MFARCVLRSRIQMLNAVVGPMVGTSGAEWKGHKVPDGRRGPKNRRHFQMKNYDTPEAKEDALMRAFAGRMQTVKVSSSGDNGGTA